MTPPAARAGQAYLEGTLTSPPDSQAAYTTIDRVRAAVHAVPGAGALVGGRTAIGRDVARASAHDRNLIIPLILVVVFVILGLLLRALVAPLILIATVVLSFAAAGFVLASTFAVLATIPATFLIELGFAIAFGILLDTIIVRSVLVTALNLDLGHWMWWPAKLAYKPDPATAELRLERAAATIAD